MSKRNLELFKRSKRLKLFLLKINYSFKIKLEKGAVNLSESLFFTNNAVESLNSTINSLLNKGLII